MRHVPEVLPDFWPKTRKYQVKHAVCTLRFYLIYPSLALIFSVGCGDLLSLYGCDADDTGKLVDAAAA